MAAALAAGVRVVGVATGKTSFAELHDADATWTAHQVPEVPDTIKALAPALPTPPH